jgi:hypothetical protein
MFLVDGYSWGEMENPLLESYRCKQRSFGFVEAKA